MKNKEKNENKESKIKGFSIGKVALENRYILAPMAGATDLAYRQICKDMGAGLVCTEMVSAKAIFYQNKNTLELLKIEEAERPVSLQLFGNDPDIISEMAKQIEEHPFDILDLNMGCPVPKVVNNGEGSALMKNPLLIGRIIEKTARAIQKPLTIKIRKGFEEMQVNAVEIARIAQESGAAAIVVHGRTREQYYSGKADWNIIRQVKEAVKIPVIGNGDIFFPEDGLRMIEETGCDGVMIGRGAQGNPWIFKELLAYEENGISIKRPSPEEICEMVLLHGKRLMEVKGEYIGMREIRKHAGWYTKGLENSASLRYQINKVETFDELKDLFSRKGLFLTGNQQSSIIW